MEEGSLLSSDTAATGTALRSRVQVAPKPGTNLATVRSTVSTVGPSPVGSTVVLSSYASGSAVSSIFPGAVDPTSPTSNADTLHRVESGLPLGLAGASVAPAHPLKESPTITAIRARAALRINTSSPRTSAGAAAAPVATLPASPL